MKHRNQFAPASGQFATHPFAWSPVALGNVIEDNKLPKQLDLQVPVSGYEDAHAVKLYTFLVQHGARVPRQQRQLL